MKRRIILHIDMDYFFAQVEERENPHFKGRPIVVGADPKKGKGRGAVATCNYIARKYGIKSAMPISEAWRRCPQALFLPVNSELYRKVSEKTMEIIRKYSKVWEKASLDEAYLDISFLRSYKKAEDLAQKLKKEIFEKEKLTATIGIGPNKMIAKMAANIAKPDGLLIIKPSQVEEFLEPLDIEKLPGIGQKTAEKLRNLGINKIKELKKISKTKLKELFGIAGEKIYERTRGIDETTLEMARTIKSIGKEHTFEKDTRNPDLIFKTFEKILENVYQELLKDKFSFRTITVICRFQGFETHTKSQTLKTPEKSREVLEKIAKKLLLKFILENPKLIRLIGVRVSSLRKQ